MKAHLLYRDRDFDWQGALQAAAVREAARTGRRHQAQNFDRHSGLPWNAEALIQDLELDTLFTAMARDDGLVFEVAKAVILTGANHDLETIRYRQNVLQDCLNHPAVVRELYAIAVETVEKEKRHYLGALAHYPDYVLRWSIKLMEMLLDFVKKLRKVADTHADKFVSEGWSKFFATVRNELSDEYIAHVQYHLRQLKLRKGVLLSAQLGRGNKGTGYVLHLAPDRKGAWLMRLVRERLPWLFARQPPIYGFSLHPRDESGARMLSELQNRGIGIAANALGQSADHVRNFFAMLRTELAFHVGCVNLQEQLAKKGEPLCFPSPAAADERRLSFRGLYDVCLALNLNGRVVGNDANADGKDLVIVTGANQGGKSTFLRSVGLAQLMMQSGMFVPAESFSSSVCDGLFTHHKREEDAGMKSGKLDEELGRMSDIVDHITPYPMILFNDPLRRPTSAKVRRLRHRLRRPCWRSGSRWCS
jgi:DNA mismatch repair ATPase MutS